jgi:hypothetical protein
MDQEKEIPAKNLISLFKNYYKLGIHHFIGNSGHAIFTGLLYKFNEMGFPENLKISIQEICTLSALDIRTFRNARKLLIEYRHYENDPESWIIDFESSVREYGIYTLNYTFLLQSCNNFVNNVATTLLQKNGDAPISSPRKQRMSAKNALPSYTILNNTILNETTSPNDVLNLVQESNPENSAVSELKSVSEEKPKPKSQRKAVHGFETYDEFFTWLEDQPRDKRHIFEKTMAMSEQKLYDEWRLNHG